MLGFGLTTSLSPLAEARVSGSALSSSVKWDCVLLILGALAVSALFYDRFFLRGIDYLTVGVAKGRALLNQGGHESSPFSILGNFFLYSYLFPLIRAVLLWEERSRRALFFIIFFALVELACVSYLMGGRTAILLTMVVCLSTLVVRRFMGKAYRPAFFSYLRLLLLGIVAMAAFGLFFWFRSDAFGNGDSHSYFRNICGHLTKNTLLDCDFGVQSGPWQDVLNYLHLAMLYAVHGVWLTDGIVQSGWQGGWITPQGLFAVFLTRFGLEAPSGVFEGFWVPAPASLLNDFGPLGMVCLALAFGTIVGVAVRTLIAYSVGVLVYVLVFALSFWFLSFLIFPANVPGVVISVLLGLFLWGAHQLLLTIRMLIIKRYP